MVRSCEKSIAGCRPNSVPNFALIFAGGILATEEVMVACQTQSQQQQQQNMQLEEAHDHRWVLKSLFLFAF